MHNRPATAGTRRTGMARHFSSTWLSVCFLAALLVTVPGLARAAGTITIKAAVVATAEGAHTLALQKLKESLEKNTNGAVDFQIYTDSQLGDEREIIEGVSLGTIEVGVVSTGPVPNFIPEYRVLDFPYLFTDLDTAYKVLNSDVGKELLDKFAAIGVRAPSFWDCGFRYTTTNKPVVHPSDIKGLKLRTMENELHMALFRHLGATPTPMAISEFLTAVRQGTVDGHENVLFSIYTKKIHESNRFIGVTRHLYSPAVFLVNQGFYDSLPADIRAAFDKAEEEARVWVWDYCKTLDENLLDKMRQEGVTVTQVDVNEWQEACKGVYDEYKDTVDQRLLERIRQASASASQ